MLIRILTVIFLINFLISAIQDYLNYSVYFYNCLICIIIFITLLLKSCFYLFSIISIILITILYYIDDFIHFFSFADFLFFCTFLQLTHYYFVNISYFFMINIFIYVWSGINILYSLLLCKKKIPGIFTLFVSSPIILIILIFYSS